MAPFDKRQAAYGIIGGMSYGISLHVLNIFPIMQVGGATLDPGVAVVVFLGIAHGPWVGFLTGLVGRTLGDALSFGALFWNGSLASGLIGLLAGFGMSGIMEFRIPREIVKALVWGFLGATAGAFLRLLMLLPPVELVVTTELRTSAGHLLADLLMILLFVPLLMVVFSRAGKRWRREGIPGPRATKGNKCI